jgi:hypothetical protein
MARRDFTGIQDQVDLRSCAGRRSWSSVQGKLIACLSMHYEVLLSRVSVTFRMRLRMSAARYKLHAQAGRSFLNKRTNRLRGKQLQDSASMRSR